MEQAELRLPGGRHPRAVAVKRLRTALIEGDQELLDFVREGALLKRLRHPCATLNGNLILILDPQEPAWQRVQLLCCTS